MSTPNDTRLVPITAKQASRCPVDVMRAYDAAPEDALEVASVALGLCLSERFGDQARAVLVALGMPQAEGQA